MTSSFPQFTIALGNPDAPNTIWITADPGLNRLVLSIEANVETRFAAARPVPYGQARGATGSLLYLDLTELALSDAEFDAITVRGDGWDSLSTRADRRICLAPGADFTQRAAAKIELHIDHVALARPPAGRSVDLTLASFRVAGVTRGNLAVQTLFPVVLQLPPDGGGDLHEVIALAVAQPILIGSNDRFPAVANTLSLELGPGTRPREVRATEETAFTLTFVYADAWPGYGAVCTRREAADIRVLRGQGAARWTITRGGSQQSPSWLLQPEPGTPILGETGLVELRVEDLVTTLAGGPTLMVVSYSGVPGYQAGAYAVTLRKVPHVQITSIAASPDPVVLHDGSAEVTISWTVEDAGGLTLMPGYHDVRDRRSFRATIRETTHFNLIATGIERASSGNQASAPVTATVLPVIDDFSAQPFAIYAEEFPLICQLAWNVNTRGQVELVSSTAGPDPNRYAPQTQIGRSIERPQMLTLMPAETPQDLVVRRSLVLSAFSPLYAAHPAASPTTDVAFAPAASFAVAANAAAGTVTALDTVVYKPLGSPVATGRRPVALAFTRDGTKLAVANAGDGTVSVLAVTAGSGWPPYSLAVAQTITVGGTPRAVALSPDDRYLYVVTAADDGAGTLVVLVRAGSGEYGRPATLAVGRDPRAVAVTPSGAQLFVPNAGDDTVTVIGVVSSSGRHQRVYELRGFDRRPVSAAVTGDERVVLVVCEGSGIVYAFDAEYPDLAERRELEVGGAPCEVALVPGGGYALVANAGGSDALALLGLGGSARSCRLLARRIGRGRRATGVAVSPDAGVALVTEQGAADVGLLTLANYTQRTQPVEVGAQTTDVAVTPDSKQALVWHNALTRFDGGTPSTGYYVYELASQTVTQQSEGTPVIAIAPSPRIADRAAYVIARGTARVDVVSTTEHTSLFSIDVSRQTSGTPRAIAVSADARTLFVLTADAQRRHALLPYAVDVARRTARPAGVVELFTTAGSSGAFALASPDGATAWAISSIDRKLWIVTRQRDGSYQRDPVPLALPGSVGSAAASPDGTRVFVLGKSGTRNTITAVETVASTLRTVTLPSVGSIALNALTVSPDGTRLFATDGVQSGIRVFDADSLRLVQTISWDGAVVLPYGVAVTPTGTQVLSANVGDGDGPGTLAIAPQVQPSALEDLPVDPDVIELEEVHADA
ncbi:beta-propeller fold lactonase family protein [Conexibacter woesei]|uniref:40-residue YVTN family beta-propeller repeat protein n=1 Tax=Conexibacter woesei (strain DSM 14684 / CCUG 47730 / CIP 108061 / JCM 11494 / NBRC 100937 / ID131577) TaxID=469383 RepID=D3F8M5_CONWI|nr:beta-propeller fold lactonase family protein [Conexibacter woesei]ADB50989.1 conserved hypothetical protein [Conexibacter woesei DSM 14684]